MRGSRRSKAIALLGSAGVLGALLVAAPSVRATAVIDTLSLGTNTPWSVAVDATSVYVGQTSGSQQPGILKVNPIDDTYSPMSMPPGLVGMYTWVARGSVTDDSLYASVAGGFGQVGGVVRLSVVDDTWHAVRNFAPLGLSDLAVTSTDGKDDTLYVTHSAGVLILNPDTLAIDDSIPLPNSNTYPRAIALVGDDSIVVTQPSNSANPGVYIISTRNTDDSILNSSFSNASGYEGPLGVAVSPDNAWIYLTLKNNSGVPRSILVKINAHTGAVADQFEAPQQEQGNSVAVAADGTVYMTTSLTGGRQMTVLPQGSFAQATSVTLSTPAVGGLAVAPNGRAYVGTSNNIAGALQVLGSIAPPPDPSPTPATPPGAPTDVVAKGGWKSVTVDWSAPANQGSFPITTYLVKASPGGQLCLARRSDANPTRCTFTSLTAGTQYTFRVQALNGGGWGAESAASNAASPQDLRITSQQRKPRTFLGIRLGSEVRVGGTAAGYPAQTRVDLWIKLGAGGQWVQQTDARVFTDNAGRYSWSRNFGRDKDGTLIGVRFSISGNFSNEVTLPPLR